ncbi:tyrosinase family protein [Streptomyces termitum]|uniref:Tyrosinase n=1 Tax=Streptomyces termitum TaxID=67368 RepID=A0A918SUY3_9ACTN|nr:tyrosinase family protein [Streptomyces termitum]GHA71767.1 tyrosinase [Streptomyces termitum]
MVYTRKNQRDLTASERRRFVAAVLELKRRGEYDEFVRTHIDYYTADGGGRLRTAHMTPSFLPWHRRFLLEFERALRRIDGTVTVPYWDWTRDNSPASSIWAEDFMGGNGRRSDLRVTTGPFAYGGGKWTVKYAMTEVSYLTRDLGRPGDPIALPTAGQLEEVMRERTYDTAPWNSTSPSGFRNRLEGWAPGSGNDRFRIHNRVHRWVGGLMLGGGSVNDPVFWLHHSFVDLVWSRWQQRNPGAAYLPATPPPVGDAQYRKVIARHQPMQPWGVTPAEMADHSQLYRYA